VFGCLRDDMVDFVAHHARESAPKNCRFGLISQSSHYVCAIDTKERKDVSIGNRGIREARADWRGSWRIVSRARSLKGTYSDQCESLTGPPLLRTFPDDLEPSRSK